MEAKGKFIPSAESRGMLRWISQQGGVFQLCCQQVALDVKQNLKRLYALASRISASEEYHNSSLREE